MPQEGTRASQQQIEQAMNEIAADFVLLDQLKNIFPRRIIDATQYNNKYSSDRRAVGEFVGPEAVKNLPKIIEKYDNRIKNPRVKDWGDILILYIISKDSENLKETTQFIKGNPVKHPGIMIAIPNDIDKLHEFVLKMKAVEFLWKKEKNPEFQQKWQEVYSDMRKLLKKFIRWENWDWYYLGELVEKQRDVSENGVISVLIEKIYSNSINFNNSALSRKHYVSALSRKKIRKGVNKILSLSAPIMFSKGPDDLGSEILTPFGDLELMSRVSSPGWEEEWEVSLEITKNSPLKELQDFLYQDVLQKSQKGQDIPFEDIMRKFLSPPWGLSSGVTKIIFSMFWRKFHPQFMIFNRISQKEAKDLNFQNLTDIFRHPSRWVIRKRLESKEEERFIEQIMEIFPYEANVTQECNSLWDKAKWAIYAWYDHLPRMVQMETFENPYAMFFLRNLKKHINKNSRDFFFKHMPSSFGILHSDPSLESDASKLRYFIMGVVNEINAKSETIINEVWKKIARLFELDPDNEKELTDKFSAWLKKIDADRYHKTYRGDSLIFYNAILSKQAPKKIFLEKIPREMGMGTVIEWDIDKTPELIARLDKAQFQMDIVKYLEMRNLLDPQKRRKFIGNWLLEVLKQLRFSPEETEEFLTGYLEEISGNNAR